MSSDVCVLAMALDGLVGVPEHPAVEERALDPGATRPTFQTAIASPRVHSQQPCKRG
jgi:hypothetical protein